ncbi:MAG: ABC-type multidrug transport system ATPase subunit [Sphingobacteriales bacterium]|jgi:ABC-type multidrug transport system ATPase subunit
MILKAEKLGMRFGKSWVFKNLDFQINPGDRKAILGRNGSGKSTFLKVLAGFSRATKGTIKWNNNTPISFGFCAPYYDLYEDLTLEQLWDLHSKISDFTLPLSDLLDKTWLSQKENSEYNSLSSGMKQRFKLGLALFGNEELIFLDEPTSNLDKEGKDWYHGILNDIPISKSVVIATNEPHIDLNTSFETLEIASFKNQ